MFIKFSKKKQKQKPYFNPTQVNRLSKLRRWENFVEGTRQNNPVTSGEGVTFSGQPVKVDTKMEVATV